MWERGKFDIGKLNLINIPKETAIIIKQQGMFPISCNDCIRIKSIRSITKTLVAIAVLKLADEGKLSLQDDLRPLVSYYSDMPPMIIDDLLNQRLVTEEKLFSYDVSKANAIETLNLIFSKSVTVSKEFHYTNSSYFLLGYLLELKYGKGFLSDFITSQIMLPLGIDNYIFKRTFDGYTYAASGIQLTNNDLIKIAEGIADKSLINAGHVKKILETNFEAKSSNRKALSLLNKRKYAYGFWRCGGNIFYGDGKEGQLCIIDFDNKTIITALSDLPEGYDTNSLLKEIEKMYEPVDMNEGMKIK